MKLLFEFFSRNLFSHIHEITIQTTNKKKCKPKNSLYMKLVFEFFRENYYRTYLKLVSRRQLKKKKRKPEDSLYIKLLFEFSEKILFAYL